MTHSHARQTLPSDTRVSSRLQLRTQCQQTCATHARTPAACPALCTHLLRGSVLMRIIMAAAMRLSTYEASPMSLQMASACAAAWSLKAAGMMPGASSRSSSPPSRTHLQQCRQQQQGHTGQTLAVACSEPLTAAAHAECSSTASQRASQPASQHRRQQRKGTSSSTLPCQRTSARASRRAAPRSLPRAAPAAG